MFRFRKLLKKAGRQDVIIIIRRIVREKEGGPKKKGKGREKLKLENDRKIYSSAVCEEVRVKVERRDGAK